MGSVERRTVEWEMGGKGKAKGETYRINDRSFPSFLLTAFVKQRHGTLIPDRKQRRRTHDGGRSIVLGIGILLMVGLDRRGDFGGEGGSF